VIRNIKNPSPQYGASVVDTVQNNLTHYTHGIYIYINVYILCKETAIKCTWNSNKYNTSEHTPVIKTENTAAHNY